MKCITGPLASADPTSPRLCDLPDLLTVVEYARFVRRYRGCAYENVRTGTVPSVRLGRAIRIPRAALQRVLAGIECYTAACSRPDTSAGALRLVFWASAKGANVTSRQVGPVPVARRALRDARTDDVAQRLREVWDGERKDRVLGGTLLADSADQA